MTFSPLYKFMLFVSFIYCYKSFKSINRNVHRYTVLNEIKKHNQCVISSKNKQSFCNNEVQIFIDNDEYFKNKKLITISPGGFKGFYILGILTFLKENYKTDDLLFSGASAGAWNSLFMCYNGNPLVFAYNFLDENIRRAKSISELQYFMKYKLLSTYKNEDFDLKRLFIGVTTFKKFAPKINIYSDFNDLEDAINCCMASSHIPLITGGITNKYKNMFSFDGGFSSYPYLDKERLLHISFSMWETFKEDENRKKNFLKQNLLTIKKFSEFFSFSKNNLLELFDNGYNDAKSHKQYFDEVLESKIDEDVPEF